MRIAIVGGGPESELADLNTYHNEDVCWVGVDRGNLYLLERGIVPQAAIGDFDSITDAEWIRIKTILKADQIQRFPSEKDQTDLEIALLWALKHEPQKITIFGATGGRLDHFFGTLSLLMNEKMINADADIEIIDRRNRISLRRPGRYHVIQNDSKEYFSFFPLSSEVTGFTLTGFKYPLTNHTVQFGSTLYVSNELIGESGTFSFAAGILLVVRSADD
ncbi:thiamine diphosphokinase [Bacillus xiapuensis]|uniref:thiamine diphosphokinase n=1 Tax=Bacillus xiapuensis TaxID=2014075 RepID=UPI000C2409D1|nr:thiamine diphosphokinase [Bacillus xiapuensis]